MHGATFVADLAVVLGVAAVTCVVARLLRQPTILGYLLAGLIVGPYLPIPLFADADRVAALAEFGVILVMFAIGLEFRLAKLARVLPASGFTGLVQISFLLWCGLSLGQALGWSAVESAFLGTGVAISSTMVVSRVFAQTPVSSDVRQFVLGILVIQDLAAVGLIAAMTAVAAGGGLAAEELAGVLVELAGVLVVMVVGGLLVVPRAIRAASRLESREILAVVAIGVCFAAALLAEKFGYSVALGAFIAGMLVAESGKSRDVEHLIEPVRDMFAAVFFVSIGMTVDPSQAWTNVPVALLVTGVVVAGQFLSVSTAGVLSGNGLRRSITGALSLGQIGEFAFILAAIGIGAGVARPELQPILVTVAVVTAFTTPLLLSRSDLLVQFVDRHLPRRLQHLVSLFEAWLSRFRARPREARQGRVNRAVRVLMLDGLLITAIVAAGALWLSQAASWLGSKLSISSSQARLVLEIAWLIALAPPLLGLVRNTLLLARRVSRWVAADEDNPSVPARVAGHTFRAMIGLAVLLGVGAPMIALLKPFIGPFFGAGLLAAALLVMGFRLWKSAGEMEREFQSGAGSVASLLASQTGEEETTVPSLLPGLDSFVSHRLSPEAFAVGKSLKQLELRAKTGATVLALQRQGKEGILPTAREILMAGDLLAIAGSPKCVHRARLMLDGGPEALGTISPVA